MKNLYKKILLISFFLTLFNYNQALSQSDSSSNEAEIDFNLEDEKKSEAIKFKNSGLIQILNKTNAKAINVDIEIGKKISFGSLKIILHKCWQASLDQKPESKMLIEVFDSKNDQDKKIIEKRIFYGWIFASSPSLSGIEHSIYDITALKCK